MSNKVTMQDLSISNFSQKLNVDGIKGGDACPSRWGGFNTPQFRAYWVARFPYQAQAQCVWDPIDGGFHTVRPGILRR